MDNSITVSEENLLNPPSTSYFLPSPPPENEEDDHLSDVSSSEDAEEDDDVDDDAASVKTDQLTPAHLHEAELKALRRRMKKSYQWLPTPSCIKKELQANGRWPLHSDKAARQKQKQAKIKRRRERQLQKLQKERALAARKAAQTRVVVEKKKEQKLKDVKRRDPKVQYTMPVAADEPTYCYCGDVSYGEMIACENEVFPKRVTLLIIVLFA